MDWDKLRIFDAAAQALSLTAAGEKLGLSQSAVSRQISALEASTGVPLFQRHARGLMLTSAGKALHDHVREMAAIAGLAEARLKDSCERPIGELRVTAPVAFGLAWLVPRLAIFADSYPEMRLQLLLDDREYDLMRMEAECAIRLWPGGQADLIQRKLADMPVGLFASKAYLAQFGTPQSLADLDAHRLIAFRGDHANPMRRLDWLLHLGREEQTPRTPHLAINNVYAIAKAIEGHAGIGSLPLYIARSHSDLVPVLRDIPSPRFALYFLYPADLKRSRRVAAFAAFLMDSLSAGIG